jgi:hypothetical protein
MKGMKKEARTMGRKNYTKKNPRPLTQKEQWKKSKRKK